MKIEKSKFIILIIILTILGIMPRAYAKTSIEIKPSSTVYTNKTISEFFDESMKMKDTGEGLEGSNVDVHMATNTDWAIVSYFSNSAYGTSGLGVKDVKIGEQTYASTNGNITGVMNFGKNNTYTSGVISNYGDIQNTSETEEAYDWGKSIIENMKEYIEKHPNNPNNPYVDLINDISLKDMAVRGLIYLGDNIEAPYCCRIGLFTLYGGVGGGNAWYTTGANSNRMTFRPVIWN